MIMHNPGTMVDVIDVTLFKFNHYDNLIWTKCLNQVDYMAVKDDQILISPYQLQMLLEVNFERELNRLQAVTFDLIHKDASSLFFLSRLLEDFENLKWIKITLNRKRHFSRMVEDFSGSTRQIKYSFKVLKATIRLTHMLPLDLIRGINPILNDLGMLNKDKPFGTIKLKSLIVGLETALASMEIEEEIAEGISFILDNFDQKIENDNPDILLVTDW